MAKMTQRKWHRQGYLTYTYFQKQTTGAGEGRDEENKEGKYQAERKNKHNA
jgi:hypothetical protein